MYATLVNSLVLGKMDYSFFDLNQQYQNSGILARNQQVYINALIDVVQSNVSETIMVEEEEAPNMKVLKTKDKAVLPKPKLIVSIFRF